MVPRELVVHLAEHWTVEETADRAVVTIDGSAITVTLVEVFGTQWVSLVGALGSPRHISPMYVLERNAHAAIGAICFVDGELVVRQRLPLANMRHADLDAALRAIALQCAQGMRELRFGAEAES